MGARYSWAALLLTLFFASAFVISEKAREGTLRSTFLHGRVAPALSRVSSALTDLKFRYRGPRVSASPITLVEIDEASLAMLGRWPWPREVTASLISKIFAYQPRAVGLDILFSESDQLPESVRRDLEKCGKAPPDPSESPLAQVVQARARQLVLAWSTETGCFPRFPETGDGCPVTDPHWLDELPRGFEAYGIGAPRIHEGFSSQATAIWSVPSVTASAPEIAKFALYSGFVNALLSVDGTVRSAPLIGFVGGVVHPALALEMARIGLKDKIVASIDADGELERLGLLKAASDFRVNRAGLAQVNFRGPSGAFKRISAFDLLREGSTLEDPVNRKLASVRKVSVLRDSYVLVGATALGLGDYKATPFDWAMPGLEVHATVLDNLLSRDFISTSAGGSGFWILLALMTFGIAGLTAGASRLGAVPAMWLFGGAFVVFAYVDFEVLFSHNRDWNTGFLYLETTAVMLLTFAAKYVAEEQKKKFIRGAFARYLAPAVVDEIVKDPTRLVLGGTRRPMTILFSDIRGFTTFSERMDAKRLSEFLNEYLGVATRIVFEKRGTLDKYIGDAVMAFWGAPVESRSHALDCCRAAVGMMSALEEHRPKYQDEYGVDVHIGVGINTGEVSVGNMGSELSFSYTVIGDSVNLASRLEGATKVYGVGILATQATLESIRATGEELPRHRVLDLVKVKGKKNAVEIVEILHLDLPEAALAGFARGRELYSRRDWDGASAAFGEVDRIVRQKTGMPDGPSEVYLKRCE
ncbi:MAG TPA: adenylate/guanylate cyclase domain-containing protein, partial [Bdellovibrionota bacterium]|nr:adenylate/guanylate cyclase domain-containing protein [Bdellovibrionota bacterium]